MRFFDTNFLAFFLRFLAILPGFWEAPDPQNINSMQEGHRFLKHFTIQKSDQKDSQKGAQSGPELDPGAHKIGSKNHINLEVGKSELKSGRHDLIQQCLVPNRAAGEG